MGVALLAPYRTKTRDRAPQRSALLSRLRYRIDTVFSQLSGRYSLKRVWAKDLWHLAGRLLRKVLSHTALPSCSTTERVTPLYSSLNSSIRNPHIRLAKFGEFTFHALE